MLADGRKKIVISFQLTEKRRYLASLDITRGSRDFECHEGGIAYSNTMVHNSLARGKEKVYIQGSWKNMNSLYAPYCGEMLFPGRVLAYAEAAVQSVLIPQVSGACVLNNVHALVLACMHLQANPSHDGGQLRWLYDIHLLVSAMSEDEQVRFANFAVGRQIQNVCLQAVQQCRERFHTVIPGEVERILSTPSGKVGLRKLFRQSNIGLYVDDLKILPGLGLKVRLLKELLFPPPRYLLSQYGKASLLWLHLFAKRFLPAVERTGRGSGRRVISHQFELNWIKDLMVSI